MLVSLVLLNSFDNLRIRLDVDVHDFGIHVKEIGKFVFGCEYGPRRRIYEQNFCRKFLCEKVRVVKSPQKEISY